MGEATRVVASIVYKCSQTVETLQSQHYLFVFAKPSARNARISKNFVFGVVVFLRSEKKNLGMKYFGKISMFLWF